ncbi:MAG: PD-(D/E)XK nuclease family protein [Lactobacillus sp.]|nr:PD-(D/E)XK nuclease family protein [Lactobacillus sp.]
MISLITGRQSDDLESLSIEAAVATYLKHPQEQTFLLVPNHIKFTTEVRALRKLGDLTGQAEPAVKNLHILSFSRLAWFFLRDAPGKQLTVLDDAGGQMLVRKVFSQVQSQLHLLQTQQPNPGLMGDLYQAVQLGRSAEIDFTELSKQAQAEEARAKFHDLGILSAGVQAEMAGKFQTSSDFLLQFNQLLADKDVSHLHFLFCGFAHFSQPELMTIKLLTSKGAQVKLYFETKTGALNQQPVAGDYDYVVQTTIQRLQRFWRSRHLRWQEQIVPASPRSDQQALLNRFWTRQNSAADSQNLNNDNVVQLVKADSRYAEAYFVARTIYQQVALGQARFRDFLVLAPDLQAYETYLLPILRQNQVPFFDDLQRQMKYHPLVVLLENLRALTNGDWSTSALLAILKTNLLIPSWYGDEREFTADLDLLENFVLAHGINHKRWLQNWEPFAQANLLAIDHNQAVLTRLERLRKFITSQIEPVLAKLETETDPRQAATSLFEFLVESGVARRLDQWRKEASDRGDQQAAQEPEQVWDLLIALLQDYLLLAPAQFDEDEFFELLTNGFSQASFSQIPSTLDAVNVSEFGMVQQHAYRQVFIIGATSTALPKIEHQPGFITSENIASVQAAFNDSSYLEDQQRLNNLDQDYQFGRALSLASQRVYLSYPVLNAANERLEPSIYFDRLQTVSGPVFAQHDLPARDGSDFLNFVTNPAASLGYLAYLKQAELLKIAAEYEPALTKQVLTSAQFDNQPENIGPDLAQQLYGKKLSASVSQLETYYGNSFEYFLTYGLRLKPRLENALDVVQAGNYYHQTMDNLVKYLRAHNLQLKQLSAKDLHELVAHLHTQLQEQPRYQQLQQEPLNQYLFSLLNQTTHKLVASWHSRSQNTQLQPRYSELGFGLGQPVPGLSFDISDQIGISLRGKIDRVDLAEQEDEVVGQVIDYKSSAKSFDLGMFASGLALQMVSYLDVLAKHQDFFAGEKPLALLGAFYQTVTGQVERLNLRNLFTADLQLKPDLANGQQRLLYKGLLINDPDLIRLADQSLRDHQKSQLYGGTSIKKKGGLSLPRTATFSPQQFDQLLAYDEYLLKQAGQQILNGQIELNPYRRGQQTQLQYSNFKDIFFFDPMLNGNRYHEITYLSKTDLFALIKTALENEAEHD